MLKVCTDVFVGSRRLLLRECLGPALQSFTSSNQANSKPSNDQPSTSYSSSGGGITGFHRFNSSLGVPAKRDTEYVNIVHQLKAIDTKLRQESSSNGLIRIPLSTDTLPQPIPKHDIEPGLHTVDVHVRAAGGAGTTYSKWLRRAGRTPVRVQSVWPDNKGLLLHMDSRDAEKLLRVYGRHGCTARVIALRVVAPTSGAVLGTLRVKPQRLILSSNRNVVEGLDALFCPQDRIVHVDVPIKLLNDDVTPGVKKGGWLHITSRTVRYQARGSAIPACVEVDVGSLEVGQDVRVRQLPIPEGTRLPHQDYDTVVVRCTTDVGND